MQDDLDQHAGRRCADQQGQPQSGEFERRLDGGHVIVPLFSFDRHSPFGLFCKLVYL